ncbi:MAG: methionine sulfoxide reductase [Sulfurovum sp. 39-42-12]|jgi:peptide methionine sulfoxide reductase msrA/msrB|nr:MAG: methionine sulfoxide reductase [Sulfurovum sp. 35-42-20]OYZ24451.1 MAG: methionine sulfoxide reductase [Sulfurovum sp. 16-42-52]OYZ48350.1 MAG: methionine sulfoxide reductase [Sulfurovum sp. 24-42-9]OZA44236.1 MAG: methionine sulfoxide reductase [Sulfurovum sp. 17-42-90]OZA61187.1 MAG: methionine sulfoxide reductase [Sulfurovum sp. 39-42-12]
MYKIMWLFLLVGLTFLFSEEMKPWITKLNSLSTFEKHVLVDKGTERAFSGEYVNTKENGTYVCKVCGAALYKSDDKFDSHCGWPSFDDAIPGAIKEITDADGSRTEITCANCGAHMGHVFKGEGLTTKNVRHCVNSVSLEFQKKTTADPQLKKAYFAGGCFWGVEYYLEKMAGVKEVTSGFMGGEVANPSYEEVVGHGTGHLETVEVVYDASIVSYETLAKAFFEIHDPTQRDGQGPDIGSQYLSAVFVSSPKERETIEKLISILEKNGLHIATKVLPAAPFYKAEGYHQDYYERKGSVPYCHRRVKRF